MSWRLSLVGLVLLATLDDKPVPKFPVDKETTYVTGPADKDGYIDYEAVLNERLRRGITPEKNANALLWKALGPVPEGMPPGYFRWLGIPEPPREGAYLIGLHAYLQNKAKLDESDLAKVLEQHNLATKRPWTAKDYPHLAGWLQANDKPLAVVTEAVRRPEYYNPAVIDKRNENADNLMAVQLTNVEMCREVANTLVARALLRLGEGKSDEAWQDLVTCHRLGRHVSRGATYIESAVGIGIDQFACQTGWAYLDRADVPSQQLRNQLKELQSLPPLAPVADKVDFSERLAYLDLLQSLRRMGATQKKAGEHEPDWVPAFRDGNRWYDRVALALRVWDRAERLQRLDVLDAEVKGLQKEDRLVMERARQQGEAAVAKVAGKAIGNVQLSLHGPLIRRVLDSHDRIEQFQRNLYVAFALAAYRRDHGRYPPNLTALAPDYLKTIPGDVYTGKALVYRPTDDGYLLYSFGVNGRDDGGRWLSDDPRGDDPRIRMPQPKKEVSD